MGVECICFSFVVGILPFLYGLYAIIGGKIFLTSWSRDPIRGSNARMLGLGSVLFSVGYYAVIIWAWSKYDG
jgi:hypothetical protein